MNNPDHFRSDDALDDEATAWLCERAEGFGSGRAQAFAAWCEADSRNAAAVARVERTLAILDEMPQVRAPLEAQFGRTDRNAARAGRRKVVNFPRRAWLAGLAAASIIAVVTWWTDAPPAPPGERYVTAAASQRRIELIDGSVVDLNAGSDMRVQFTAGERRVVLAEGEAHFSVKRDAARPFVVTAGDVSVRAIGTAFNVRLAVAEVAVLVTEGKVEVDRVEPRSSSSSSGAGDAAEPPQASVSRAVLTANERTVIPGTAAPSVENLRVERVSKDQVRAMLAWQGRPTQFSDVPLREIVERFNRRNVLQLVLDDATLGMRRIGGMLAMDQPDAFVRLLEEDGDIVVERRGENEIVLRAAR